jgi:hypothetical protein
MKQTLLIKQLLSSPDAPGKNFAHIKVLVEDRGEAPLTPSSPPFPFKPITTFDTIIYDQYNGYDLLVAERNGNEMTLLIITNNPEDFIDPKFFDHVIWFNWDSKKGE